MSEKRIEFKAVVDTAEFDKAIENLQRKVREAYRPAQNAGDQRQTAGRLESMGMGGNLSKPSMEAYQRSMQSARRELDQIIQKEAGQQERLIKSMDKRLERLGKEKELHASMAKDTEKEIAQREKIARIQENLYKQQELAKQRDNVLNQTMDARQQMSRKGIGGLVDAYKSGGISGVGTAMGGTGGGVALAGALAAGASAAGQGIENLSGFNMRLQGAKGSAIQNTVGTDQAAIAAGRSPFEAIWMQERQRAAGIAKERESGNRWADRFKSIGGVAAGALGGAAAGAIGGSAVPLLGTAVGGIGGAIAGGIGAYSMQSDRTRLSMNPFAQKEYGQVLAGERAKDFRQVLEDLKNQDPAKKLGIENFEQNFSRDLGAQRMLGMNNQQFRGANGFLANQAGAGFGADQAIGMATNIVGAGGSTRMGRSALGNQMERMGYSNAPQVLGALSGSIQDQGSGKSAAIAIISEAFKVGLDSTDFAEENRKFTQSAANIIARTGATNVNDQDKIVQALGQFMGEKTNAGVQSAQTAYERSQERGSALGGRRGALRLQQALKDKGLRNIPMDQLSEILGMNPENLTENSDIVQYGARKSGYTPKQFVEKFTGKGGINENSRYQIPGNQKRVGGYNQVIQKFLDEKNLNYDDLDVMQKNGELPQEVTDALAQKKLVQNSEEQGKLNPKDAAAAAGEGLVGKGTPSKTRNDVRNELNQGPGGRIEDNVMAEAAKSADLVRAQFLLLVPALSDAVKGAREFANETVGSSTRQTKDTQNRLGQLPSGDPLNKDLSNRIIPKASNQQQAGKDRR